VKSGDRLERRITWAGIFIAAGLLVQSLTSFWVHPVAFMCFIMLGTPLVVVGVVFFLYSLLPASNEVSHRTRQIPQK